MIAEIIHYTDGTELILAGVQAGEALTSGPRNRMRAERFVPGRDETHITGGTVIPITSSTRINSRRTTAAVASKKRFRSSSASVRM